MCRKFWVCVSTTIVVLVAGCSKLGARPKKVALETSMGDIVVELNEEVAPLTVKNFLWYVEEHFYDGTIFHRVIPDFMIQGGGFTAEMKDKETRPPIANEFRLSNVRGTVAMAKLPDSPDSATSEFFINLVDNSRSLDYQNGGFTVFGKVVKGMEVVDKIAAVKRTAKIATIKGQKALLSDVPVEPVVIKSANVVSGL